MAKCEDSRHVEIKGRGVDLGHKGDEPVFTAETGPSRKAVQRQIFALIETEVGFLRNADLSEETSSWWPKFVFKRFNFKSSICGARSANFS